MAIWKNCSTPGWCGERQAERLASALMTLKISPVAHAVELLRAGKLVAIPTETVYGLAANALDESAVRRIFAVKGRPFSSPLIVHVADLAMARELALEWSPLADALAARFWPGPLT